MARKPKKSNDLKRKTPKREPYDRVLIICEGEKTEPLYFKGLIDYYKLSTANIDVTNADGTDPISVVKYAKNRQSAEKKQGEQFDRVYCVFDKDEHHKFDNAYDMIINNKFNSARSWPCFEYWLLLHFKYQRKPYVTSSGKSPADNCYSELTKEFPEYRKKMNDIFQKLLPRLKDGIKNAKKAHNDAEKTDEKNPSTEVFYLVEYLQNLKSQ
ncbi:MAG: RloB domain-containing protein [Gammaproteobacteria bacterium]|nr:MAG: RloB domain-containing protein [Gammaproteobacteria bacterium]UTW43823.1 RloB domain-containing protein [bacterium SCSIO 12844]